MSDTKPNAEPAPEPDDKPHKVDEAVQEDAGRERSENEGYD